MKIKEITRLLEQVAPPVLQESYDNAGLLTGDAEWECTGVLVTLDITEQVVQEAIEKKCNLIVAHHPVIFGGLKKITGSSYVERTVIASIKNNIALYAIHTNLDNVIAGVSGNMADRLGLVKRSTLLPRKNLLKKLQVFVPATHVAVVQEAMFNAGAGNLGNYSECSFVTPGEGSFKAGEGASPFLGEIGLRHTENEQKVEVIFQAWHEKAVLAAMLQVHPYEEVAYDIIALHNEWAGAGSGIIGELVQPMEETGFLSMIKEAFALTLIRHTGLRGKPVKKVALCGGAGSFMIREALSQGADVYISGDIKYHEFFDAEGRMVLADIGHYESEQGTISLLFDILKQKYPNFAVLKTGINTNPVQYFL